MTPAVENPLLVPSSFHCMAKAFALESTVVGRGAKL